MVGAVAVLVAIPIPTSSHDSITLERRNNNKASVVERSFGINFKLFFVSLSLSGEAVSQSERKDKRENTKSQLTMGLDLLLFQADKDGDPELIKKSQRARFKSDAIVDEIQEQYKQWTRGRHFII